jgi:hypothetical protein
MASALNPAMCDFRSESHDDDAGLMYEEDQALKYFACDKEVITAEVLTSWYANRVRQIEKQSCMVDHALTLITLARERNITVSPEMSLFTVNKHEINMS